ncbi:MAG: 3-hydroxyacyl-CoA dehydrogenase [Xanthobacteraceae bacterium]|nr:MAG: 3-hydroxyacyl-CoA dehydrogenase [Xanthobacteraceae bacterium]
MTAINAVTDLTIDGDVAVVTLNHPPVNALSQAVRDGIHQGIAQALANPAVSAIVLICAGRTFIAGADISEFGKPPAGITLPEVHAAIENATKPVIAAIHGTALGGGLETALVCHYRVAVPSAKVGLPEVKLGLIPGAGGTQRLPRLVGAEKALDMIVTGVPIGAKAALEAGVIDELAPEHSLRGHAIAFARRVVAEKRPLAKVRDRDDRILPARGNSALFEAFRKANAKKYRGFEAWLKAVQAVENAVNLPFDEGMAREREMFLALRDSTQAKAQRHVFFAEREVAKIPDVPADTPSIVVNSVGVIGAGTMGGGIAMNFLNAGIPVTIVEMKQEALDRGLGVIRRNYESTARKGRMTAADVEKRMGLLTGALDFNALANCDLIIEAVFETMEVKKDVFGKLDAIVKPGAILASNTSYLNIDEIAAITRRPQQVVGLHFFSPANVMKLLEIVRGEKTSKPVIATAMQLARRIGKVGVLVGVCYGFVGNRMLAQRQREATKLVLEGAMPWDVDRVLHDFGLPMGPFAMSDLAGLDLGWSRETSKSSTLKEILCEMDRRGQKTGAGFYDYDENRAAKPSPVVEKAILDFAAKQGITRRAITDDEILKRCLYPMINEGAKILEEGKALRAGDIDTVWINGYGWPVYTGGPMFYGDTVGAANVLAAMKDFEARFGADFKPAALLERLAAENKRFADL